MDQSKIRNIAIIAHVDHGKTTLVDELFKYSGMFRNNQIVAERLMDSMDLEKERGITITSKNGSFLYHDWWINIVDTPGHADFGGQVERVLRMVDGVLLVVDAQEGPMPQTYFVLKKALALNLRVIVVINKIDKPAARVDWVVDQVFDLFVKLNAPDNLLDFPIVYASAKEGYGLEKMGDEPKDMGPVCEAIVKHIPAPGRRFRGAAADADQLDRLLALSGASGHWQDHPGQTQHQQVGLRDHARRHPASGPHHQDLPVHHQCQDRDSRSPCWRSRGGGGDE
jgi:GTP-binding protein